MRRREFITLLGGTAAWPLAAGAQPERMRRIGVLMNQAADDPDGQARVAAFQQALQKLGWIDGGNVRVDIRWGEDNVDSLRRYAGELVALTPDVILVSGGPSLAVLQDVSSASPIAFVAIVDPVGAGFVDFLAHLGGKWMDLLKQIAPGTTRVAVLRDPDVTSGIFLFDAIRNAAQSLRVEVRPVNVRDVNEIERAVTAFARSSNGGLIVTPSGSASVHRDLIITLAAKHKIPAIYPYRYVVADGGLMSYAPDLIDPFRSAAGYVDRILKGEKPANLSAQAPTKYELVINLKTAKALSLEIPPTLLARADEVIE